MGWSISFKFKVCNPINEEHDSTNHVCEHHHSKRVREILLELGADDAPAEAHKHICWKCLVLKNDIFNAGFVIPEAVIDEKYVSHSYGDPIIHQPIGLCSLFTFSECLNEREIDDLLDKVMAVEPPPYDKAAIEARDESMGILEWVKTLMYTNPKAYLSVEVDR
jgi:hypothetical protein